MEGTTKVSDPPATIEENNQSTNQMAAFSSDIRDVMGSENQQFSAQGGEDTMLVQGPVSNYSGTTKPSWTKTYPGGLSYKQTEAILAGVAAVIGTSEPVQSKLAEMLPQFYSESGKVSIIGMLVLVIIVAVLFYFGKQTFMK